MTFIDEHPFSGKRVLLRVDFNVSLNPKHQIADDTRIRQAIPTIEYLLKLHNAVILISHLGRPLKREGKFSLKPVLKDLERLLPHRKVEFVTDFLNYNAETIKKLSHPLVMLENIRFYPGEETNDREFAKKLSLLADVYVNDAFAVDHRAAASTVGITKFLPSYGGLLLKKEITMLDKILRHPQKPVVAILGGSKISTKLSLIDKLVEVADYVLLGGGLANNFLLAKGLAIGKSIVEKNEILQTKHLIAHAKKHKTDLVLPIDVVVSTSKDAESGTAKSVSQIKANEAIFDIGPESQAHYASIITKARTILWNGPVGYFENPAFARGTDFLYYAITENRQAVSVVGGGETLAAMKHKEHLDAITHVSTGGGAMLEYIENGTLPGIETLNHERKTLPHG